MCVVVRRYVNFLIILLIPTPLILAPFLQQHPYFFVHLKKCFFVLNTLCHVIKGNVKSYIYKTYQKYTFLQVTLKSTGENDNKI